MMRPPTLPSSARDRLTSAGSARPANSKTASAPSYLAQGRPASQHSNRGYERRPMPAKLGPAGGFRLINDTTDKTMPVTKTAMERIENPRSDPPAAGPKLVARVGASGKKKFVSAPVDYDSDDDPFEDKKRNAASGADSRGGGLDSGFRGTTEHAERFVGYHLNAERKERVRNLRPEEAQRGMFMDEVDDEEGEISTRARHFERLDPLIDMLLAEEESTDMFTKAAAPGKSVRENTALMLGLLDPALHTPRDNNSDASSVRSESSSVGGRTTPRLPVRRKPADELKIFMATGAMPLVNRGGRPDSRGLGGRPGVDVAAARPESRSSSAVEHAANPFRGILSDGSNVMDNVNSRMASKQGLSKSGRGLGAMTDHLTTESQRTAKTLARKQDLINQAINQATQQLHHLQADADTVQREYLSKRQEMMRLGKRAGVKITHDV